MDREIEREREGGGRKRGKEMREIDIMRKTKRMGVKEIGEIGV